MMPDYLAGLVLAGAIIGSVLGSWVLTKLSPSHPTALALCVGSLFTAAQYMNLQVVAHPQWYKFIGLASFIPPYLLTSILGADGIPSNKSAASKALRFASPKKSTPVKSGGASPKIFSPKTPVASADELPKASSKSLSSKSVQKANAMKAPSTPVADRQTPSKSKTPKERKGPKTPKSMRKDI